MVVAAAYILGVLRAGWTWAVEDLGMPVVLPAGACPEQTLIPNLKHHAIK